VSQEAGQKVQGSPTSWLTGDGPYTVEHIAITNQEGDLLVFYWSPRNGRWRVVNASGEAGQKVQGALTSWLTTNGGYTVEHVGGTNSSGDLLVFYWSPRTGRWRVVNASSEAGQKAQGSLTAWLSTDGQYTVEHIAGISLANDVLIFYWSPRHGRWRAVNASTEAGQKAQGSLTSWLTVSGSYTVEHVATSSPTGDLLVFYWSPRRGRWQVVNATREARAELVTGAAAAYQYGAEAENVEVVVARGRNGEVLTYWWRRTLGWQALNLAPPGEPTIESDPTALIVARGQRKERIAAVNRDGHVVIFTGFGQERTLTDRIRQPYRSLVTMRNVRRKVLAILWDPHRPGDVRPKKAAVEAALFGPTGSVRSYFLENSDGLFTIEKAGMVGWYNADHPPSAYWPGGGEPGRDSGAEAIRKAAVEFDFRGFDLTGDGSVSADELAILFILPGTGDGGGLNRIVGEDFTTRETARGITVDGVKITWIAEVSIGSPPGPGIVAHELSHLLLGHGDMYFSFFTPSAAGIYSLMDQDGSAPHLDPFAKLKLGWLRPRLIFHNGRYDLRNIETRHTAWVLLDPSRGSDEYFLVENRWPGSTFDRALPDRGLAIWHIMETPAIYDAALPPPNVSPASWAGLGSGARTWPRKGIRMIRPIQTPPFNNSRALWDGSDLATGYDLLSEDPIAGHATLKWGNGSGSGFALRLISGAGPRMQVTVDAAGP
jgi:M6 family metalloprotease-like protein